MAAEQAADGYLFDLYRRYIGEPEDRTDVYVGFGLFLGGIGLAIVASYSSSGPARSRRGPGATSRGSVPRTRSR